MVLLRRSKLKVAASQQEYVTEDHGRNRTGRRSNAGRIEAEEEGGI
jgi:hypothetical protein